MNILNTLIRDLTRLQLPRTKETYIDMIYNKFKEDHEDYENYKIVTCNEFGIYFINEYPGLDILNCLINNGRIMNMSIFEDKICNEKFVLFMDAFYYGDYREIVNMIEVLGGEVVTVYAVYADSDDQTAIRLFDENDLEK